MYIESHVVNLTQDWPNFSDLLSQRMSHEFTLFQVKLLWPESAKYFLREYEITTPPGVTLNLLAEQQIKENLVIPDLFAFESMNSGSTFPQFGFTCERSPDRDLVCVEPQPVIVTKSNTYFLEFRG